LPKDKKLDKKLRGFFQIVAIYLRTKKVLLMGGDFERRVMNV
jgi:hypothetical protein